LGHPELFAHVANGHVTLFQIARVSSLLTGQLPEYPLGEGVQYVAFIRDAPASRPLEATAR
jgi:hypothetical protein